MSNSACYDIVIIGAGCAGLSFAYALNKISQSRRILILEKADSMDEIPNKTWSYWTSNPGELEHLAWHDWQSWYLSSPSQKQLVSAHLYSYQSIHSDDYLNHCIQSLTNNKNITILFSQAVLNIQYPSNSQCTIKTSTMTASANWVIDTRPPVIENSDELVQSFKGRYIQTEKAIFNATQFGLMDQLTIDKNMIKFTYLLPKNKFECLIETTFIHRPQLKPDLEHHLNNDIQRICKENVTKIIRSESGKLPMTSKCFNQPKHARHIIAGQAAGALRPSSGYGFKRILLWANHAAKTYHSNHLIPCPQQRGGLQNIMDRIFLNTLKHYPKYGPQLFLTLAHALTGDEFSQFMMDQVTPSIWYKIIRALPTKIMLKGMTKRHEPISN